LETLREKQKVQWWQLKSNQLVHIILKIKFRRRKLNTNAGYVNNIKGTVDHLTSGCPILAKN